MTICIVLLLFTIVVDYMMLSGLSAIVIPEFHIDSSEFGLAVAAYGICAAISSLVSIGFADRFDRKKYLLFFYAGFLVGITACGFAPSYSALVAARAFTGVFGGVVGATCLTIIADIYQLNQRGRVMGFVQMAYAAGQIGGLPLAIQIATFFSWKSAYYLVAILGLSICLALAWKMKPLRAHLKTGKNHRKWSESLTVVKNIKYWKVYSNNALIVAGDGFLLTFDSIYMAENLQVELEKIPLIYLVTGSVTFVFGPLLGRLSDQFGKLKIFSIGTVLTITSLLIYVNIGEISYVGIMALHILIFIGINARMVCSTSLGMGVPATEQRGSFMAFDSSLQQMVGALAALVAGTIVHITAEGSLERYPYLGIIITVFMLLTIFLMRQIDVAVKSSVLKES